MVDDRCTTELLVEDLDDDEQSYTTEVLDFPPPIPHFGPPACQARAQRRRCVRRQYRSRARQRGRGRQGGSIIALLLLISGIGLGLHLARQLA